MSDNKFALVVTIGTICGICFGFFGSMYTSKNYGFPNTYRVDTVAVCDTIHDTIPAQIDTVKVFPNVITTPIKNVKIDTITTVVNQVPVSSDVKITIDDMNLIK